MTESATLHLLGGGVLTSLLAAAAVGDFRSRRIPNRLVLSLALAGLLYMLLARPALAAVGAWAGGLALGLAIWLPVYAAGMLGAGDVKLFAAAAAWFGPTASIRTALLCAIVGGVLSVGYMIATRTSGATFDRLRTWALLGMAGRWRPPVAAAQARHQLPYGVALAIGIALAWWFPHVLPLRFG